MLKHILLITLCVLINKVYTWTKAMENPNLYEGDMILTPAQLKAIDEGDFGFGSKKNPTQLWPNGVIPYTVSSDLKRQPKAMAALNKAFSMYHKYTCIRFHERRSNERAYVKFFKGGGCSSGVGYGGGYTSISLDEGCWWHTTVMHEIAHTLGFYHEQSRPDRDSYVEIMWNNIGTGAQSQFKKQPYSNVDSRGSPYDFRSMMHYNWNAFAKDPKRPSIRTLNPKYQYEIGQREGFSHEDIRQINKVYNCRGTYPTLKPYVPPPPGCYDLGGGCVKSRAEGRCTSSSWQSYMRKSCRRTCGFCGDGGGPQPTSGTGGNGDCKDVVNDCYKNASHCNDSPNSPFGKFMRRSCRKYCKFC